MPDKNPFDFHNIAKPFLSLQAIALSDVQAKDLSIDNFDVIIEVTGGMATVTKQPEDISVLIIDHDIEKGGSIDTQENI